MINRFLKTKSGAVIGALFCTLLWGTAFPVIKVSYNHLEVAADDIGAQVLFAGERFFLAGFMVLVFCLIFKRHSLKIEKNSFTPVLLLGLTQTAAQYFCSYIGVANTSGTKTSVITACNAFFSVLLAPLFFRNEKLSHSKVLGCVVGFAGIVIINLNGIAVGGISFLGEGMVLLSALCSGVGSFLSKASAKKSDPIAVTAYQLLLGSVVLIAVGLVMGGNVPFKDTTSVLLLLYLALVSALAFALWTVLLRFHSVGRICIFNLLIPIFGTLWSGILLGENILKWENLLSLLLVSVGIFVVNFSKGEVTNAKS